MANVRSTKNGKVNITGLTFDEYDIILAVLGKVKDIMAWDDDMECYTDHDNFLMSMDEEEHKTLMALNL